VARETWILKFDAAIVPSFTDEHLARAVKIAGVSDDHDRVAACEKVAQDALGARASAVRSQSYYLDVTHPQANKGAVVTPCRSCWRFRPSRSPRSATWPTTSDVPQERLFHRHGQCSDEVKNQARAVTDSNEDEGFAKAVRRFILGTGTA